ncbi:MAG: hypothetical protein ACP5T6_02000 [Candidatus Micrarchaeia archaeon]
MFGKLVFKEKRAKILLYMRSLQQPCTTTSISKACDTTYVHTTNFINECIKLGLISNEKHGKLKELKLTEKGIQLADLLTKIESLYVNPNSEQDIQKAKNMDNAK